MVTGCVTAPQTTARRVYVPSDNGADWAVNTTPRRGQAAAVYAGYREQSRDAHRQAIEMDRADREWSRDDRENRRQTQHELDGEVRREIALRRQTQSEGRDALRTAQSISREAKSWTRLLSKRRHSSWF